ncbi:MAG: Kelch repeat-containing protein [Acidimicrobiia bacterium]
MRRYLVLAMMLVACSGSTEAEPEWMERAAMSVARSEHPALVLEDEIVVAGGLVTAAPGQFSATATVEAYDPGADTWRSLPDLPGPRHHLMAVSVNGRPFVIGGFSEAGFAAVDEVWELVGGLWEARARLPRPVGAGAVVVLEGLVYVVGGVPDGGLFRYDPEADEWTELTGPGESREHVSAVVHDGEIWSIGGRWEGRLFTSTEIYDPATDSWRPGPDMNDARSGFGAASHDGSIYVAGGEVFSPDQALASVERLGPDGKWEQAEPLPFGLHGNPLVSLGDALYLPGGSLRPGGIDNPGTMLRLEP